MKYYIKISISVTHHTLLQNINHTLEPAVINNASIWEFLEVI